MKPNPLNKVETLGQSIWLDYISRDLFSSGKLKNLINNDSLRGMTSNPTIFEKSIAETDDYDQEIKQLANAGKSVNQVYDALTINDVGTAADEFLPVYKKTKGLDGYVSLEVSPSLAHDTNGTIEEARRLWKALNRPNVLIKVPGTKEGLPAIQQLISEGINVNVTLLFGLPRYREVAKAYIAGLESRIKQGKSVANIASVASFFLSRIDVLLDPMFEKHFSDNDDLAAIAKKLHGELAIASAKNAYCIFKEEFSSVEFKQLEKEGAHVQRVLWASTSTKNPAYSDVKYVEALIGPLTVNTLPLETIDLYRDHGEPMTRLESSLDEAKWCFQQLPKFGIDIDKMTQQLEDEGVEKFTESYNELLNEIKIKMSKIK